MSSSKQIAADVMLMSFPWRTLGINFGRNVTLLRLPDRRVVVHSTAKFTSEDIAAIGRFGEPAWLVDATLMHDTFAKEGRAQLPEIPYLAPTGFTKRSGVPAESLWPAPAAWTGEIDLLKLDGVRTNEYALFHRRSRTLVVADLFFSFPAQTRGWPRVFVQHLMRLPRLFGISAFYYRLIIKDKPAFARSMEALLEFDCDRLIVAHWKAVETEAKRVVKEAVAEYRNR